jgi:putative endonuclease
MGLRDFIRGFFNARTQKAEYLRVGRIGEDAAAAHIKAAGLEVIARNAHVKFGEADIVACDAGVFVIVEVKTRVRDGGASALSNAVAPEQSVTGAKRRKLRRIGSWLAKRNGWERWRIDVVAVEVRRDGASLRVEHVRHWKDVC